MLSKLIKCWILFVCLTNLIDSLKHQVSIKTRSPLRHHLIRDKKHVKYLNLRDQLTLLQARYRKDLTAGYHQPVEDVEDMIYVASVTLGTPKQEFQVVLDTGSANLWVGDKDCVYESEAMSQQEEPNLPQLIVANGDCPSFCEVLLSESCSLLCGRECCRVDGIKMLNSFILNDDKCSNKHRFNQTNSLTYREDGTKFGIHYGTGSAEGFQGIDVLCFTPQFCIPDQTFGQATSLAKFFNEQPIDGILGLGFKSISVNHVTPPLVKAVEEHLIDEPIFTVYMGHFGLKDEMKGGMFTYGGLDDMNCGPVIAYEPLTSATYWQFNLKGVCVDGYCKRGIMSAISDTGTSLIAGPQAIIEQIGAKLGAKFDEEVGAWFIDCNHKGNAVNLEIGSNLYQIKSTNYILPISEGVCEFGFFAFSTGLGPQWILGDPFLRSYCNIHNIKEKKIGFALPLIAP
uniref:Peptidase A1 domain-containing protein n=1 Tax=Rhabditophanes sp. KR3021 TaxID=114890 RepID=A0AC35U1P7_9BILA